MSAVAAHTNQAMATAPDIRDSYRGVFFPLIAKPAYRPRVDRMEQRGGALLVTLDDAGEARTFVVSKLDSPGLELLNAYHRGVVQSALCGLMRATWEVVDA